MSVSSRQSTRPATGGSAMSNIVKVVEVVAQSEQSFDDAAQQAVRETAKTVRGIKSIWIDNFSGVVQGDRIVEFRVNAKISFVVEGHP
jgi:dodecin